jgi:hypothetical protein
MIRNQRAVALEVLDGLVLNLVPARDDLTKQVYVNSWELAKWPYWRMDAVGRLPGSPLC